MPLGTKGLDMIEGDLVKYVSHLGLGQSPIPIGTVTPIIEVSPGDIVRYQLMGFTGVYVCEKQLELVAYARNTSNHVKHDSNINTIL